MRVHLLYVFIPLLCAAAALTGCISRTEIEAYTITVRDTTVTNEVHNAPGERDNGVVFPQSWEAHKVSPVMTVDSIHERKYPDFLRAGGLELAGFIGTGGSSNSWTGGLFGAYGLLDDEFKTQNKTHTVYGGLVRLMPFENRLRWFQDSPNWTFGSSLAEAWIPEYDANKIVWSVFPFYFRKRFFLRDEAPYIMVQPTVGIGLAPWQYLNIGGTVDVGSWGGLNFRAYLGYIAGYRNKLLSFNDSLSRTAGFPYIGLGVSVLDFVNKVEETRREWKDYQHHSIEINVFNFEVVHSFAGTPSVFDTSISAFPTGVNFQFATMSYPLWSINKHLFVGTSLFNITSLGLGAGGMSVLPIRVGWHIVVIPDELTNQTYAELNYYPSSYIHLADRLTLDLSNVFGISIHATLGYVNGNGGNAAINTFLTSGTGFGGAYVAIGAGISDNIFGFDKITPW